MSWWNRITFARPQKSDQKEVTSTPVVPPSASVGAPSTGIDPSSVDTSIVSIERPQFGVISTAFARYNLDDLVKKKGLKIYSQMRVDEQVKAVVTFKRDAIISRGWHFCFDEESKISETEQKRRIRIFEKILERMPGTFVDALNKISVGREFGYSLTEKVYKPVMIDGAWQVGLGGMLGREPSTFEFHTDAFGTLEYVQQLAGGTRIDIDLAKFVHYVHNPEFDEYFGRSDLREAYRAWFMKDQMLKMWGFYAEKLGGGALILSLGPDANITANSEAYRALQKIAENFKASGGIVLPKGVTAQFEFPPGVDTFEKAVTWFDLAIARALLVPNLLGVSHTGQTGAYAQSQTQLEAFAWTLKADADRLEACLNEQLFYDLGEQNFGDQEYPYFKFKIPTNEHVKWIITSWKEMIGAKAVIPTEDDEKIVRTMLDMPMRTEQSVVIEDPAVKAAQEHEAAMAEQANKSAEKQAEKAGKVPDEEVDEEEKPVTKKELTVFLNSFAVKFGYRPDGETTPVTNYGFKVRTDALDKYTVTEDDWGTGQNRKVAVSSLIATQRHVNKQNLKNVDRTKPIVVLEDSGQRYILDGHHRAVLAKEAGETSVEANVLEGIKYRVKKNHTPDIREVRLNLAGAREKVDFAIIDRKQKLHFETLAADVSTVVARTVKQLLGSDEDLKKLTDGDTSDIANLDVPGMARGRIKGAFKNALSQSWALGRQLANEELGRSKRGRKPTDQAHFASLRDKAADYFENNGFRMAGNVSDGVRALMQNELQNAVKYGKSPKQTRESIWDSLTSKGFVSRESVRDVEDNDGVVQALDALWVDTEEDAAHYLDTLARTNLFEAMNEARYGEFTDPALEGFVVAFRYSAILDDRTTEICSSLHDSVYEADSEVWNAYRPPNHFNCRSILIPVTQVDVQNGEWNGVEDDAPEVEPQKGFK